MAQSEIDIVFFRGKMFLVKLDEPISNNPLLAVKMLEGKDSGYAELLVESLSSGLGVPEHLGEFPRKAMKDLQKAQRMRVSENKDGIFYILVQLWSLLSSVNRVRYHQKVVHSDALTEAEKVELGVELLQNVDRLGVNQVPYEKYLGLPERPRVKEYKGKGA